MNDSNGEGAMPDERQRGGTEVGAPDPCPPTIRIERSVVEAALAEPVPGDTAGNGGPVKARPRYWVWLLLLVLIAGVGSAGWFAWPLYQRYFKTTWIVDAAGGGDTLTIAEAISRAADDATVLVRAGTYGESLVLGRPVHLKAADPDVEAPLIAPPEGPCIVTTALYGSIVGLRFQGVARADPGAGPAVPCLDIAVGGVLVEGNQIDGSAGPAIRLRDGAVPTVRANSINGSGGPGILVSAGARGAIIDNRIEDTGGAGIVVRGGSTPEIAGNNIAGSGAAGVLFREGAGGRFQDNVVSSSGASGIEVGASADPVIAGNKIEAAEQAGIFVYDLGRGRFRDNEVLSSGYSGLVIAAGGAPVFVGNLVRDNAEHGILAIDGSSGIVEDNRVLDNKGHGIALAKGTDVELGGNTLEGNKEPQVLEGWLVGF